MPCSRNRKLFRHRVPRSPPTLTSPSRAGLSHLGKYREEEHIVPSGLFDFSSDGSLVWVGSQEVESDLAQDGDVLRPVVFAISGAILVEDHVEDPVELVLDRPMGADDVEQLVGW